MNPTTATSLALTLLYNVNQFMVFPVLGFYSQKSASLSVMAVTGLLSLKSLVENLLTTTLSLVATRLNPGYRMAASAVLRLAAFLILASTPGYRSLLVFAALLGLGSALGRPALRTALARHATTGERSAKIFGLMHVLMNAGVITGPLVALALTTQDALWPGLPLFALAEAVIAGFVAWRLFAEGPVTAESHPRKWAALAEVLSPALLKVYGAQFLFWAALGLSISGITLIHEIHPTQAGLRSALFSVEGLGTILWQLLLLRLWAGAKPAGKYTVGGAALALGLALYLFSGGGAWVLIAAIAIFALGDALVGPQVNADLVAATKGDTQRNTAFAVLLTLEGLGEAGGNALGGLLISGLMGGGRG